MPFEELKEFTSLIISNNFIFQYHHKFKLNQNTKYFKLINILEIIN